MFCVPFIQFQPSVTKIPYQNQETDIDTMCWASLVVPAPYWASTDISLAQRGRNPLVASITSGPR